MRLDKFLKVSRIIKRRTVAKEIADKGRITINDKIAKSSTDVSVKVEALVESTKKQDAGEMFSVVSETYKEQY